MWEVFKTAPTLHPSTHPPSEQRGEGAWAGVSEDKGSLAMSQAQPLGEQVLMKLISTLPHCLCFCQQTDLEVALSLAFQGRRVGMFWASDDSASTVRMVAQGGPKPPPQCRSQGYSLRRGFGWVQMLQQSPVEHTGYHLWQWQQHTDIVYIAHSPHPSTGASVGLRSRRQLKKGRRNGQGIELGKRYYVKTAAVPRCS